MHLHEIRQLLNWGEQDVLLGCYWGEQDFYLLGAWQQLALITPHQQAAICSKSFSHSSGLHNPTSLIA
jgi:hypothetical protein